MHDVQKDDPPVLKAKVIRKEKWAKCLGENASDGETTLAYASSLLPSVPP